VLLMSGSQTLADVIAIIERHIDEAHRRVLRCTTDPGRGLPRFKRKAEAAQDERILEALLTVLAEVRDEGLTLDRLRAASYDRIDGDALVSDDKRLRRRLQGIPETAPLAD